MLADLKGKTTIRTTTTITTTTTTTKTTTTERTVKAKSGKSLPKHNEERK